MKTALRFGVFFLGCAATAWAQTPPAAPDTSAQSSPSAAQTPPVPAKRSCPLEQPDPPTDAGRAAAARDFVRAESLYRAAAAAGKSDATAYTHAEAGLVRTMVSDGHTLEAVHEAEEALKVFPGNALLLDVEGEALFRRGETARAAQAFDASQKAEFCSARLHYDMARYFHLDAQYASEQKQLTIAQLLAPRNRSVRTAQTQVAGASTSQQERIARLTERLESAELSPDDKASLQRTLNVLEATSRGTCEVTHPFATAKIPIVPISNGPMDMYAAGLDVTLNGKKRRFELDTGASGLLLSRDVARAAGLITEAESLGGGIGDAGPRKELLAHVDSVRIGDLEFHNCLVRIFDQKNVLDVAGLIGADVFASFLVTLDIPGREVRLAPLPKLLDEPADAAGAGLDTSGSDATDTAAPRNRYIAPEMQTWSRVFRAGHMLIFPTNINNGPTRLFLMDTGASREGLISTSAAKEVTGVSDSDIRVRGISGQVADVKAADKVVLTFGNVRETLFNVPAVDLSGMARNAGTEISGLLGFVTLSELVLTIDYRDSLVHVVYDPNKGFHRH